MKVNESEVEFSLEERHLLRQFFNDNSEFINNTNLYNYENIKMLGDMYQKFLEDNNQIKNERLLLFLLELRYNQLTYKLTKDSLNVVVRSLSKKQIPNFILNWFKESRVLMYYSEMKNSESLKGKLNQNAKERRESFEEASKKKVK